MSPKNQAAVELGRKGGKATAAKRTKQERSEAARKAVEARWAKLKSVVDDITVRSKALEKTVNKRQKKESR